jgi:hemolysin III
MESEVPKGGAEPVEPGPEHDSGAHHSEAHGSTAHHSGAHGSKANSSGYKGVKGPADAAAERVAELLTIKPKWRGWIHAVATPLAVVAGIVLVAISPTLDRKLTSAIYALTGVMLFSVSAVYHRGTWSPDVRMVLKRLDHSNVMLVIAGTYTPLAWSLLERQQAILLLWLIWSGALLGVLFRVLWLDAPRGLYVPVYVALGCGALVYLPAFFTASVPAALLICAGGIFYIAGAVFYGIRKPNFSYQHFGFHELFHAFTVLGFAAHFAAISIAVLN